MKLLICFMSLFLYFSIRFFEIYNRKEMTYDEPLL